MKQIGCFISLFLVFCSCSKKKERIKPVLSDITEAVYASATVKATEQYQVFSTVNGILKDIKAKPGDTVKNGDVLFILDHNVASLNTENARLALELSRENNRKNSDKLQEMELDVKLSKDKYLLDSSLYARQKKLWEQNIGTQLDFEQRRLSATSSKNNYEAARKKLGQLKTQLENELEKTTINYDINRQLQSDYIIRSTISGRVFDVLKDKGELVTPQAPLAVLGKSTNFILEMNVDENDIARVKVGQNIEITMDSYKGQVFDGVVDKIYPIMDERSRTFQVDAHFVNPPSALYPNLTAEANIIIQTRKNALIIPRNYLENGKYVWISKDEKKQIKTGLQDYRKVEIIEGLDTSKFIYKPE